MIDNWLLQADKQARDISEKHSGFNNNASESNHEHADEQEPEFKDNEKVRKAVLIAGYGLDAVAREKGVEHVVQGIKSFDTSGSDNPLRDLFMHLGVETVEDFKEIRDEAVATRRVRDAFRAEYGMPKTQEKTKQGLMMAIADMKELIAEVEGVDPRYAELRRAAEAAGMGYFEYAVMNFERRGLMELFTFLMKQREQKESPEQVEDLEKSSSESEGAVL